MKVNQETNVHESIHSSPPGTRAASRRYGERYQRCPALNHMCNQSKLMARRQVRVTWDVLCQYNKTCSTNPVNPDYLQGQKITGACGKNIYIYLYLCI